MVDNIVKVVIPDSDGTVYSVDFEKMTFIWPNAFDKISYGIMRIREDGREIEYQFLGMGGYKWHHIDRVFFDAYKEYIDEVIEEELLGE